MLDQLLERVSNLKTNDTYTQAKKDADLLVLQALTKDTMGKNLKNIQVSLIEMEKQTGCGDPSYYSGYLGKGLISRMQTLPELSDLEVYDFLEYLITKTSAVYNWRNIGTESRLPCAMAALNAKKYDLAFFMFKVETEQLHKEGKFSERFVGAISDMAKAGLLSETQSSYISGLISTGKGSDAYEAIRLALTQSPVSKGVYTGYSSTNNDHGDILDFTPESAQTSNRLTKQEI